MGDWPYQIPVEVPKSIYQTVLASRLSSPDSVKDVQSPTTDSPAVREEAGSYL